MILYSVDDIDVMYFNLFNRENVILTNDCVRKNIKNPSYSLFFDKILTINNI